MKKLITLVACLSLVTACKKKEAAGDEPAAGAAGKSAPAAKPTEPAAGPPVDKKLAQVGVTISVPADAHVDEGKMDMGGVQATVSFDGMSNFFVSNVNESSDNLDRTMKQANAKDWKVQEKAPDGSTWKLEWTAPRMSDPTQIAFGVAVRSKVGAALYDCGSNGLDEASATALLKICTSLK
jgi:hypothetical protein